MREQTVSIKSAIWAFCYAEKVWPAREVGEIKV